MANTIGITFTSKNSLGEDFIAQLDMLGFEGLIEHDSNRLEAFIGVKEFKSPKMAEQMESLANSYDIDYHVQELEEKNWNETWESSFEPVLIGDKVLIRAPFHNIPGKYELELIIEPKMSFGTGHHATTHQMSEFLLNHNLKDKTVLDAGCGTGILAILAEKLGAASVVGFDNEEWAWNNALENIETNECTKTKVFLGDAQGLPYTEEHYDIVLANITKNILKEDIPVYLQYLRTGGTVFVSGFFEEDIPEMNDFGEKCGLKVIKSRVKNNWAAIEFSK